MSGPWILCLLSCSLAMADIETWTDEHGRTAELELWSVTTADDVVTGHFRTKDGTKVSIPASRFAEPDAKRVREWNEIADLKEPRFDHSGIPKKTSFGQSMGQSGTESLEYGFSIPDERVVGVRKDGIVIHSCSLTPHLELPGTQVFNPGLTDAPKIIGTSWSLAASRDYRMAGTEAKRHGLSIVFTLNNGDALTALQVKKSTFTADVVVATSNNLRVATLKFATNDCLVGNHVIPPNGAPPTNPNVVRNVGPIRVWLEQPSADLTTDGSGGIPGQLVVRLDEPYSPSSVKTTRILCNGQPVQRLSEASTRELTVELECWTDFKEMTLRFEKPPSQPGA